MLSTENLWNWTTQYRIADVATCWVQSHYEKQINEQLAAIAEKGRKISKDLLVIRVVYVSLWVPYKNNNQECYIVVSVKVGYEQKDGDAVSERSIGMCKLFFTLDGTLDHDEFEIY